MGMEKRRKNRQDTKKVCKMDFRTGKDNAKLYSNYIVEEGRLVTIKDKALKRAIKYEKKARTTGN